MESSWNVSGFVGFAHVQALVFLGGWRPQVHGIIQNLKH